MRHKRSGTAAQGWLQPDLPGVEGRQACTPDPAGGGGYLYGCNPSEVAKGAQKNFAKFRKILPMADSAVRQFDAREAALLDELDAMGVSRVMLQVAHAIGFENFMTMWRILDAAHETWTDNESGLQLRMQRLAAYKRYQRNRFIEAMAAMGMSQPEISRSVQRDLGEKVSDRHIWRLMAPGRVKFKS